MTRLVEARSVAVVGASDAPGPGRNVVRNLATAGFKGSVFLVNRSHRVVAGVPAFASLGELPETPEMIVVAVNQRATVEIVREASALGIPGAVLLAAGFREVGELGEKLESDLMSARGSMSLVGPNCLGFANYADGFAPYSGPLVEQKHFGNVALVSNSGALACTLTGAAAERRISFSHVVTMGNQADLGLADFVEYFATKPVVEVIACYVEGFDDGRAVLSAVKAANGAGKLVVILKAGRTRLGGRAARTHTGALAGSALVQDGLFSRAGVVMARDLEELLALIELGSRCPHLKGRRVGVITTSGGERLLLADAVEENEIELAELSETSTAQMQALLPSFATVANPLDTTGAGIFEGDPKTHYAAARVMALDPDVDVLVASYDAKNGWVESSQSAPAFVDGVIAAHRAGIEAGKTVVVISLTTGSVDSVARDYLEENGVACLMGLHSAMRAVSLLLKRGNAGTGKDLLSSKAASEFEEGSVGTVAGASVLALGGRDGVQLEHAAALDRLEAAGLTGWSSVTALDEQSAVSAAAVLGYPVVLKWDANVAHRARIGGVALALKSEQAVRQAFWTLMAKARELDIACEAVLVQPMVEGGLELFLGGLRDQQFGPIVLFGLGGVRVEEVGQVAVALAPLSRSEAESLVAGSPCANLLRAKEDAGNLDRPAIVNAILAVAELIAEPTVLAIDVNPLIALADGIAIVDCKLIADPGQSETVLGQDLAPSGEQTGAAR
ncbi:MAG: acetate--CoA ligase family protein [Acidimicrobiales bacterium]